MSDLQLDDITDQGHVVKSRASNAQHVLDLCQNLRNLDKERDARRSRVQGQFNRFAPKSSAEMTKAGRSQDSNLNFGDSRGQIMNAHTPFFDMVCEVPVCVDGKLELFDPQTNQDLMRKFGEEFHEMMFDWKGFDQTTQLCDLQMLLHGVGILAWQDEWDWRPKAILAGSILFPDNTEASLDNCEQCAIFQRLPTGDLWKKIAGDEEAAADAGWNVEAVKKTIMAAANGGSHMQYSQWQDWDRAYKNGDIYVSNTQTRLVEVYHYFVREMNGTISHKLVDATGTSQGEDLKFLFESPSRYADWTECLCLFPYDIGADGTYHSVRGLGTDIFGYCELMNKIKNAIANSTMNNIQAMFQASSNARAEDFKMASIGGGKMIPPGVTPIQFDFSKGILPALEVAREYSQNLAFNTAAGAPQDIAAPTVEETAKSVMIRTANAAKVSKGLHNRYMRSTDWKYRECWRRAANPKLERWHGGYVSAKRFQNRCRAYAESLDIPWEVKLDAMRSPTGKAGTFTLLQCIAPSIKATRSIGLGNAGIRFESASQLLSIIDRLDPAGQNAVLRVFVSNLTGFHLVDAIVPALNVGRDRSNDEAVAASENNDMALLGTQAEVYVLPAQDHVLHLGVHLPSAERDAQMCMEGQIEPAECLSRLEAKIAHASEHQAQLAANPTKQPQAKEAAKRIQALARYAREVAQMAEEQAAANPQPPEMSPEMAKVQGQLAIKAESDRGKLALKAQNQAFNQQLKEQQAIANQELATGIAAANRQRADVDTAAAIERENAKTGAGIAQDVAKQRTELSMKQQTTTSNDQSSN